MVYTEKHQFLIESFNGHKLGERKAQFTGLQNFFS